MKAIEIKYTYVYFKFWVDPRMAMLSALYADIIGGKSRLIHNLEV